MNSLYLKYMLKAKICEPVHAISNNVPVWQV